MTTGEVDISSFELHSQCKYYRAILDQVFYRTDPGNSLDSLFCC